MAKRKPIANLPNVKRFGAPKKLPALQRFAVKPRGPEHLKLGVRPARLGIGPGEPPIGFVGAHTSRSEWVIYWAIWTVRDTPGDPRKPPFIGAPDGTWTFQTMDSAVGGRVPGGSVTDFQVQTPTGWIAIRLDTERWHIFASPNQQAKDLFIKTHLKAVQKVVTIFEQDFIADDTGEAACRLVALAMRGIEMMNPIRAGTAIRRRPRG